MGSVSCILHQLPHTSNNMKLQTVGVLLTLGLVLLLSSPADSAPAPAPTVADPILTALVLGKLALLKGYVLENNVFGNLLSADSAAQSRSTVPRQPIRH